MSLVPMGMIRLLMISFLVALAPGETALAELRESTSEIPCPEALTRGELLPATKYHFGAAMTDKELCFSIAVELIRAQSRFKLYPAEGDAIADLRAIGLKKIDPAHLGRAVFRVIGDDLVERDFRLEELVAVKIKAGNPRLTFPAKAHQAYLFDSDLDRATILQIENDLKPKRAEIDWSDPDDVESKMSEGDKEAQKLVADLMVAGQKVRVLRPLADHGIRGKQIIVYFRLAGIEGDLRRFITHVTNGKTASILKQLNKECRVMGVPEVETPSGN